VNDTVEIGVCCEDLFQSYLVGNIYLIERWPFPAEQFYAIERDFRGVVETVYNHNFIAMF